MMPRAADHQPLRYVASAAICAVINNVVLIVSDRAGFGYAVMLTLSWAITGSIGYALHTRFTFRQAPSWTAYARFMGGIALGIPIAFACLALFRSVLHWPMWAAAPAATAALLIYNYLSARVAILRRLLPRATQRG